MQATERRSSKVTAQWAAQLAAIREANTAAAHKVDTFIARLEGDVKGLQADDKAAEERLESQRGERQQQLRRAAEEGKRRVAKQRR